MTRARASSMRVFGDRRGMVMVDHLIVTFVNLCLGAAIISILGPSLLEAYRLTQALTLMPVP